MSSMSSPIFILILVFINNIITIITIMIMIFLIIIIIILNIMTISIIIMIIIMSMLELSLTGYAILYFFHSYFLWLNSMAINIWLSFTSYFTRINDRTKFILCLLYSQGLPVLLCAITALVDHSGRGLKASFIN